MKYVRSRSDYWRRKGGNNLDRMADRDPMSVEVEGDKVTVKKGDNEVKAGR